MSLSLPEAAVPFKWTRVTLADESPPVERLRILCLQGELGPAKGVGTTLASHDECQVSDFVFGCQVSDLVFGFEDGT